MEFQIKQSKDDKKIQERRWLFFTKTGLASVLLLTCVVSLMFFGLLFDGESTESASLSQTLVSYFATFVVVLLLLTFGFIYMTGGGHISAHHTSENVVSVSLNDSQVVIDDRSYPLARCGLKAFRQGWLFHAGNFKLLYVHAGNTDRLMDLVEAVG